MPVQSSPSDEFITLFNPNLRFAASAALALDWAASDVPATPVFSERWGWERAAGRVEAAANGR
jgi:hypothetical protein